MMWKVSTSSKLPAVPSKKLKPCTRQLASSFWPSMPGWLFSFSTGTRSRIEVLLEIALGGRAFFTLEVFVQANIAPTLNAG
ncbi:hypothetical protein PC116_g3379 [Phytophthora cactorum]|nr:hypothetical protein Pcac1_g13565 [Phytophthora cactorum]KAG2924863.1 hypothetical protein PC114_g4347 [Phytophthora cactorum]KAG3031572.1 hypothetical protein PC120_g3037 [Phytophthora cactorum]KAG3037720.1 hypothetical protein PC119_g3412 [Phytophthora cactorum]KAG3187036.1 hypothetical protein C6341_g3528 [Phytophthora cactorum]